MGYGWRARIGLMVEPFDTTIECEFWKLAPTGVSIHVARMNVNDKEDIMRAAEYLKTCGISILVFGCTSGSFQGGVDYEKRLIKELEVKVGVPVITASTAVISALKELNIARLVVGTPYTKEMNEKLKSYLESYGLKILKISSLWELDHVISKTFCQTELSWSTPFDIYRLGKYVYDPRADAIFLSCTGLRTIESINILEKDYGKPVISSVTSLFWLTLKMLNICDGPQECGILLNKIQPNLFN